MSNSNTKSRSAKDLVCPLTARPCGELHHCLFRGGFLGPGQCIIWIIADILRRKGGGRG